MERLARPAILLYVERASASVWRLALAPYAELVLLSALLLPVVLGGVLPQVPQAVAADPGQYQQWLGALRSRWGGAADVLSSLGLLNIFRARLFYAWLAIIAAAAGLRLLQLWAPAWGIPSSQMIGVAPLALPCSAEEAWARVSRALAQAGMRIARTTQTEDTRWAWAYRMGAARWVPGSFYLGLLVLLLGAWAGRQYDWSSQPLELGLGETKVVDRAKGLSVRLEEIAVVPRQDGALQRLDGVLSVLQGSKPVAVVRAGLDRPGRHQGLAFYELGYGPSARVEATDGQGQVLTLQRMVGDTSLKSIQQVLFSERRQEWLLAIPQADLIVRLVHYPSLPTQGIPRRVLHVQCHRGRDGQLLAEEFLADSGQVTTEGVSVRVAFEYYVVLRAEREPTLPLAAVGGALTVIGLVGLAFWPPRELGIGMRAGNQGSLCRLVVPRSDAEAAWVKAIMSALREAEDG